MTIDDLFGSMETAPPMSFKYGGKPSKELLREWIPAIAKGDGDAVDSSLRVIRYTDPATKLVVHCEVTHFKDFAGMEWVVRFRNEGSQTTPILEDIQTLDTSLILPANDCVLHYSRGGIWADRAFEPLTKAFQAGDVLDISPRHTESLSHMDYAPAAGLSSSPYLPFFNLDFGGRGVIMGIGWTGQWKVTFERTDLRTAAIRAGMERTHLKLHPGEEIRLPMVMLLSWAGEFFDGQNLFRRLILAHYTPRQNGKNISAPVSFTNWGAEVTESHLEKVEMIRKHQLPIDYLWIDGGWTQGNKPWSLGILPDSIPVWSQNVGNWKPSVEIYPDGIQPISKAVHQAGMNLILWMEAGRVHDGTQMMREKPEWILKPGPEIPAFFAGSKLFDLTNPQAVDWLIDFVSKVFEKHGADCLWNDFCIEDPLSYWQVDEPEDRHGMREIRYVEGYLRYMDGLLRKNPNMVIINCAGGGRQIDLETMKRSLPLWTSDYQAVPELSKETCAGDQCHSYGSLFWLPISATACMRPNTLSFRSNMRASINVRWWLNQKLPEHVPIDWLKTMLAQHKRVQPYYYGDYYPLTEYSLEESVWMAYQMHRPDLGAGIIMAFRRENNPDEERHFPLQRIDENVTFTLHYLDTDASIKITGRELLKDGISIRIHDKPGSRLIIYTRKE